LFRLDAPLVNIASSAEVLSDWATSLTSSEFAAKAGTGATLS
jgi:hypothetical protein